MGRKTPTKGTRNPKRACGRASTPEVIAYRKRCEATGTGLSHYILLDRKAKA